MKNHLNLKASTIALALVIGGLTIAIYVFALSSQYVHGHWAADLLTLLLAEATILGGYTGLIGYITLSTQAMARWSVVRQTGIALAVLTAVHTLACILLPQSIETAYWCLTGIILAVCCIRLYFTHTASLLQEQTESHTREMRGQQQMLTAAVQTPSLLLTGAIRATNARPDLKAAAADAVEAVANLVGGFALNRVVRHALLAEEVGRWSERLGQLRNLLSTDEPAATLQAIAEEARAEADILNNLYLQA